MVKNKKDNLFTNPLQMPLKAFLKHSDKLFHLLGTFPTQKTLNGFKIDFTFYT